MLINQIGKFISKLSFILVLVIAIFGTGIPFRPKIESTDEFTTTNIVNQIAYSLIFLLSFISLLINNRNAIFKLILKEKTLSMVILWIILSIFWSKFPLITAKRTFQILTITISGWAYFINYPDEEKFVKNAKYIIYFYLLISLMACIFIPEAKDPDFNTWRGLTPQKNNLGQTALVSFILCLIIFRYERGITFKSLNIYMIVISITLLFGSFSSTAIIIFFVIIFILIFINIKTWLRNFGYSKAFILILILLSFSFLLVYMTFPIFLEQITQLFGKDTSFSGRTDLWSYILLEINQHLWIGTGFQAFWTQENYKIQFLYEVFVWLPNQSHNGYLDITNELGLIGFLLILFFLIKYAYFISVANISKYWILFPWIILISNLQESTLFRPGQILNTILILSYQISFINLFKK